MRNITEIALAELTGELIKSYTECCKNVLMVFCLFVMWLDMDLGKSAQNWTTSFAEHQVLHSGSSQEPTEHLYSLTLEKC